MSNYDGIGETVADWRGTDSQPLTQEDLVRVEEVYMWRASQPEPERVRLVSKAEYDRIMDETSRPPAKTPGRSAAEGGE